MLSRSISAFIAGGLIVVLGMYVVLPAMKGAPDGAGELVGPLGGSAAPATDFEDDEVPIGSTVRRFRFLDSRNLPRTLDEFGKRKAYVIVFTTMECPIAKRYGPKLGDLDREFRRRGVQFLMVNMGSYDPLIDAIGLAVEQGIEFPVAKDYEGQVMRALAPSRTPEICVLDADKTLRYRGRVDAMYRFGGVNPDVVRDDLREAIQEVIAGEPVSVSRTPLDGCVITHLPEDPTREVTYAEVEPILRRSCLPCHGEELKAPFSLLDYTEARRHAEMIAEVVEQRRMPPWFADSRYGHFLNDPSLSAAEIQTILDWVWGGAPDGVPGEVVAAPEPGGEPSAYEAFDAFIPEPNPGLVLHAGRYEIPASGTIPYENVYLTDESGEVYIFPEDTWVVRTDVIPSNPPVLHHARLHYDYKFDDGRSAGGFLGGYVPGAPPIFATDDVAFLIPKGARLSVTLHQVTTGVSEVNEVTVGFTFASGKVRKKMRTVNLGVSNFEIPPRVAFHTLQTRRRMPDDARPFALYMHMHLRGRDMRLDRLPRSEEDAAETLLFLPAYNFDWQLIYYVDPETAPDLRAGDVLECVAHYDNSKFNAYNPDPNSPVTSGEQTENEMMIGLVLYVDEKEDLDLNIDGATGRVML